MVRGKDGVTWRLTRFLALFAAGDMPECDSMVPGAPPTGLMVLDGQNRVTGGRPKNVFFLSPAAPKICHLFRCPNLPPVPNVGRLRRHSTDGQQVVIPHSPPENQNYATLVATIHEVRSFHVSDTKSRQEEGKEFGLACLYDPILWILRFIGFSAKEADFLL